jgi:hypothetical protein
MSTTPVHSQRDGRLDRFVHWILDSDGTIYGDERERIRWYEAIAVASSVQWLVVPWALAIMAWMANRQVAPYLTAVAVIFYAPMLIATVLAERSRINTMQVRLNRKAVLIAVFTGLPFLLMLAGLVRAFDEGFDPSGLKGAAVGGPIGMIVAWLFARTVQKRRAAKEALDIELER